MKVFVTGVCGQLGHDVVNELSKRGHYAISSDNSPFYSGLDDGSFVCNSEFTMLDITNRNEVERTLEKVKPDAVIHCDSSTDVDSMEINENELVKIEKGTSNIAEVAKAIDAKMVYISSHYVFPCCGERPWLPDSDTFSPFNDYGKAKLKGEKAIKEILSKYYIVRASWIFGDSEGNFISNIMNLLIRSSILFFPDDQIGIPTYTYDLSRLLVDMIETDKYGCYHATNEGDFVSLFELAKVVSEKLNLDKEIMPDKTGFDNAGKRLRPLNCRLDTRKLVEIGLNPLPNWRESLERYFEAKRT